MFGESTRLALVNAVYFKGNWLREFDVEKTYHAPFYLSADRGNKFEVEMMTQKAQWNYFVGNVSVDIADYYKIQVEIDCFFKSILIF